MEDSEVFCPHCEEYIAPRTFRKHKSAYFNEGTGTWDVPLHHSSDEESSTPVNCDNDSETYDDAFEFAGCENQEDDEEYMEVDLERARETIEF